MSAFLGPIHFWLYNKIQTQLDLVEEIVKFAERDSDLSVKDDLFIKYNLPERRKLEMVIDEGNIHGWLQTQVSDAESRLAFVVTELIKKDSKYISELTEVFKAKAVEVANTLDKESDPREVYKVISDIWLDGMPCDHAYIILEDNANEIVIQRQSCVHERYWNQIGGDIQNYYVLRNAWNEAFVNAQNLDFAYINDTTYKISRR